MRVVVLGATGRTGVELVRQALELGHDVVAFARTPSKLHLTHERLTVVAGDATDPAALGRALERADAVVSGLGPVKGGRPDFMPRAATAVVESMRRAGARRLVWLTGAGVVDPADPRSFVRTAVRALMSVVSRAALRSSDEAYRVITGSELDWTVARVPRLGDGPPVGMPRTVDAPPGPGVVARADVAGWMLAALTDETTIRRSPFLVA